MNKNCMIYAANDHAGFCNENTRNGPMDISSLTPDKQVKYQYWLNVIHECRTFGLTNQDWCEQNGISIKSYYYWIAKFRKLALEDLPRKEYASSLKYSFVVKRMNLWMEEGKILLP